MTTSIFHIEAATHELIKVSRMTLLLLRNMTDEDSIQASLDGENGTVVGERRNLQKQQDSLPHNGEWGSETGSEWVFGKFREC